jgi:methylmalonyl-CoA/ethylmalonyl-CoA epimerase
MKRKIPAITFFVTAFVVIVCVDITGRSAAAKENGVGFDIAPHHVGISVPNLEESIAWYHEMLGFAVVRRMSQAANPEMDFALLQRGNCYIELFEVVGGKPMPAYRRDPTADLYIHGTKHIAFEVADARAAAEA